jgi:hypothetical protein
VHRREKLTPNILSASADELRDGVHGEPLLICGARIDPFFRSQLGGFVVRRSWSALAVMEEGIGQRKGQP